MATFVVMNTEDSGPGSLRQAILDANAAPGRDRIRFADHVRGTISLLSPLPPITDALDIAGPGAEKLAVSGRGVVQILTVSRGVDVTLRGLTLREGRHAERGGAVRNFGRLFIRDAVLTENSAGINAGAIYNLDGILRLERVTLSRNQALVGGAILTSRGRVVMEGSSLERNSAVSAGALFNETGLLTLRNSRLKANQSAEHAGALDHERGRAELLDCRLEENSAAFSGGAVLASARMEVECSTLKRNTAGAQGGAIWATSGSLILTDCRVEGNSAGSGGGGVQIDQSALEARRVQFRGNSAGQAGGGLSAGGGLPPGENVPALLVDCDLKGNSAATGGGIALGSGLLEVQRSAIFENQAREGGGLMLTGGPARLINVTLSGNRAEQRGGAILATEGLVEASFVTVNQNVVIDAAGAGVQAASPARVMVQNSIFAGTHDGSGSPRPNCAGEVQSLGGSFSTDGSCAGFTPVSPHDLRLGPLQVNPPGRTPTHALEKGSVAIDAAVSCLDLLRNQVGVDQRGVRRPQGLACDSGAFERSEKTLVRRPAVGSDEGGFQQ